MLQINSHLAKVILGNGVTFIVLQTEITHWCELLGQIHLQKYRVEKTPFSCRHKLVFLSSWIVLLDAQYVTVCLIWFQLNNLAAEIKANTTSI